MAVVTVRSWKVAYFNRDPQDYLDLPVNEETVDVMIVEASTAWHAIFAVCRVQHISTARVVMVMRVDAEGNT